MKKFRLSDVLVAIIVSASFLFSPSTAYAAPITELTLTGGNFSMAGAGGTLIPGAFADMSVDGSYDGSAPDISTIDFSSTSIVTFEFGFFGPVGVYTAETDGINGPFPGVTGDLTGLNLTLDLSSWTAWWTGTAFNQGSEEVTAIVDVDGNFTAAWDALIVGGPFNGQTGSWTITGHVSAVPIPPSVWLFVSGLAVLVGLRRK